MRSICAPATRRPAATASCRADQLKPHGLKRRGRMAAPVCFMSEAPGIPRRAIRALPYCSHEARKLVVMTESKAMILGCAGKSLTPDEISFYRGERPWGFILFARNIGEPAQIRDLVAAMRDSIGRPDAPVFIDQEGGRVQRLRPPLAPNYPAGVGARRAVPIRPRRGHARGLADGAAARLRSAALRHHRRLPAGARRADRGRQRCHRHARLWQGPGDRDRRSAARRPKA